MKITFSLLKAPAKASLQQGQKSFDEQGGSIGRGEGNNWILPDPDKFLSSKHCVVTCEAGQFYITDTSTNGLFLNGASLPVGRNNKVSVSEGDTLDLGEYRLRVALEKAGPKISPFAQMAPVEPDPIPKAAGQWGSLAPTPHATDGADLFPEAEGGDPFYDASMDPFAAKDPFGLSGGPPSADPFAAPGGAFPPSLGGAPSPFGADPFAADPFGGADPFAPAKPAAPASFTQHEGNPLQDAIALPKVAPNPGAAPIPDDFWNSLGGTAGADALGMPSEKPLDPFTSQDPFASQDAFGSQNPFAQPASQAPAVAPAPVAPKPVTAPTPPPQPRPASPPEPAAPDALGENPFAHLAPPNPSVPDSGEGQLYPLSSAHSTHIPTSPPGKVPLSDRLKAMQAAQSDPSAADPFAGVADPFAGTADPFAGVADPFAGAADPFAGTADPFAPGADSFTAGVDPFAQSVPPPIPPAQPRRVEPVSRPEPVPAPMANTGGTDRGTHNLVAALGLAGQLNADQEQVLPALIGEITREAMQGLIQILRARNSIKNEFRIAVTTIQPRENNPIKFATDVDDALELLFVRTSKGYKPAVESVQDSFASIMDHQVAILAGIRAAFKCLLTRFDPIHLEQQFERQGKTGGILPGMKGAKCWSAYDEFYQELMGNFENSFQNLFGDDFVQAYEEQMRKLSIARTNETSNRK